MTSRQGLGVGGGTPYGFDVGQSERGNVLKGLDLGVQGMRVGGQAFTYIFPVLSIKIIVFSITKIHTSYVVYLGRHSHGREASFEDFRRATDGHLSFLGSFLGRRLPDGGSKLKMLLTFVYRLPDGFKTFGARNPHRPPEDIAYAVARFFQKGGSLQNYYMYHGGTNFGRTSGGPFITTSYDYDAPIDEYGLARLPKWGHLRELHKAIKLCEQALLYGEPTLVPLGPMQEADACTDSSGKCAAFLSNADEENDKLVTFQNRTYHLPAWSVSILPDCKNVAFNTAKVGSQTSIVEMIPESVQSKRWDSFIEKAGIWGHLQRYSSTLLNAL